MTTEPGPTKSVLTINGGSSSLKFALFPMSGPLKPLASGKIERIGTAGAKLKAKRGDDSHADERPVKANDPAGAASAVDDWLKGQGLLDGVAAVGHRVVHGGANHVAPERVTPEVLDDLKKLSPYDPEHLPAEIALIEAYAKRNAEIPQIACFDTAFHRDLPRLAQLLPIPRAYFEKGVRRYGFHGLSYEYLMETLRGEGAGGGRVILAHLGSGASLAAVKDGTPVDTSMAFTPAAGLVMGTRTGDLDPGLVGYFARAEGMPAERFDTMIHKESGLLGLSETSADVRDLLASRATDSRADEALGLFCYQIKKWIGAYAAALGGLDTLVFSGGIGENAPEVRAMVCEGLEFLGVTIDPTLNAANSSRIGVERAAINVRVIPTDEEITIARAVIRLVAP